MIYRMFTERYNYSALTDDPKMVGDVAKIVTEKGYQFVVTLEPISQEEYDAKIEKCDIKDPQIVADWIMR